MEKVETKGGGLVGIVVQGMVKTQTNWTMERPTITQTLIGPAKQERRLKLKSGGGLIIEKNRGDGGRVRGDHGREPRNQRRLPRWGDRSLLYYLEGCFLDNAFIGGMSPLL